MKKRILLLAFIALSSNILFAQNQTNQALGNWFTNWFSPILYTLFIIFIAWGVIRLVMGLIANAQDVGKRAVLLVLAAVIFFAFNLVVDDISAYF